MEINITESNSKKIFIILLLINLSAIVLWIVGQNINIYQYAVVGAIFEILWLPIIISLILLPFISSYFWYKAKFNLTSKFLYLLLWSILSLILLYLLKKT